MTQELEDDEEFIRHICDVLERNMVLNGIELGEHRLDGIIRPKLKEFLCVRGVDCLERILMCGMGKAEFRQEKEDEIPVMCRFYNDYIGAAGWNDQDHTMMKVLNRYDRFKAGGYGNFGQVSESSSRPE